MLNLLVSKVTGRLFKDNTIIKFGFLIPTAGTESSNL